MRQPGMLALQSVAVVSGLVGSEPDPIAQSKTPMAKVAEVSDAKNSARAMTSGPSAARIRVIDQVLAVSATVEVPSMWRTSGNQPAPALSSQGTLRSAMTELARPTRSDSA